MYATLDGQRVTASPSRRANCPLCSTPVIAKCGQILTWHWAHLTRDDDCDSWAEGIGPWHLWWQGLVPADRREVVIGAHRADIVTSTGIVIELQHSSISPEEIQKREAHYGRMMWVFDVAEAAEAGRLDFRRRVKNNQSYVSFRWKQPRKSVAFCRAPVILDPGPTFGDVLLMRRIHTATPCGGWGTWYPRDQLILWLNGGTT